MADPDAPMNVLPGSLSVVRPAGSGANGGFETFIKITADGSVTAFNGHVDLGTGIRTALGQIVAEELDVSFARVVVVLGDTAARSQSGRDHRQRNHPDHGGTAAQGRRTGAAFSAGARRRAAGACGRGSRPSRTA